MLFGLKTGVLIILLARNVQNGTGFLSPMLADLLIMKYDKSAKCGQLFIKIYRYRPGDIGRNEIHPAVAGRDSGRCLAAVPRPSAKAEHRPNRPRHMSNRHDLAQEVKFRSRVAMAFPLCSENLFSCFHNIISHTSYYCSTV